MFHESIHQEVIMKKIIGAVAAVCCLAAAPAAFAGVDVFVEFGFPPPVVVTRPVYVAPAVPVAYYRHGEPRWHERHEYFDRRHEYRERHDYFRHHGWR
jgi:hypothetical protein